MNGLDARTIRVSLWGVMLIWIGVMMAVDEPAGVASIGAGAILLAGAALRRWMGRRAGFVLTVAGLMLVLLGLNDLNGDDTGIPLFATVLIAVGALIVLKAFGARRWIRHTSEQVTIWLPGEDPRRQPRPPSEDLGQE